MTHYKNLKTNDVMTAALYFLYDVILCKKRIKTWYKNSANIKLFAYGSQGASPATNGVRILSSSCCNEAHDITKDHFI